MEKSWPFWAPAAGNTVGNTMSEDQWAEMFRYVMNTGVMAVNFQDLLNELIVTPGSAANTINIDTGAAWIQGHIYTNDSINTLGPIVPPISGTRADLIVLELKWGLDAGITAKIIPGTTNAIWPVGDPRTPNWMPTQPVTTYGVRWQLPLAQVNVTAGHATTFSATDIIDWRTFTNAAGAKSSTYVIAAASADASIRANADAVIPYGSLDAEWIINEAILKVASCGGGTVTLSEGTFDISDTITLATNVNLQGLGNNTLLQYHTAGGANPVISADTLSGSQISDLTLDGGAGSTLGSYVAGYDGIYLKNCSTMNIQNCTIQNCKNNGVYYYATSSTPTTAYGNSVSGCSITGCWHAGVNTEANSGQIQNNQVVKNGGGIFLVSDASTGSYGASMNLVSNNSVRLNQGMGIYIKAFGGAGNCSQNLISDNVIILNGVGGGGAATYSLACAGTKAMYNTITGNHFQGTGNLEDIFLDADSHGNFVTGNYTPLGCYVMGTNCSINNYGPSADVNHCP